MILTCTVHKRPESGDGGRWEETETHRHVCEFFPVVMSRKDSCLLLSLTLRLYCVLCSWQSMPSTPVTACTSLRLCSIAHSARTGDEMTWHSLIELHYFTFYSKKVGEEWHEVIQRRWEVMELDGTNDETEQNGGAIRWDGGRLREMRRSQKGSEEINSQGKRVRRYNAWQ